MKKWFEIWLPTIQLLMFVGGIVTVLVSAVLASITFVIVGIAVILFSILLTGRII